MENKKRAELASVLNLLPPVEFCCAYGSALLPNNRDKTTMVDYILGVSDPMRWHSENLKRNMDHYASLMAHLGGAKLITQVADEIGVGVHFNPFVTWEDKMIKYGVVRMHDLVQDILNWERFYLSGRLQKPDLVTRRTIGIGCEAAGLYLLDVAPTIPLAFQSNSSSIVNKEHVLCWHARLSHVSFQYLRVCF